MSSLIALAVTLPMLVAPDSYLVSTVSYHTRNNAHQNNLNTGLGAQWRLDSRWALSLGGYRNSNWRSSAYGVLSYTNVAEVGPVRVDLNVGAASGYGTAPLVPVATLSLTVKNLSLVVLPHTQLMWTVFSLWFQIPAGR